MRLARILAISGLIAAALWWAFIHQAQPDPAAQPPAPDTASTTVDGQPSPSSTVAGELEPGWTDPPTPDASPPPLPTPSLAPSEPPDPSVAQGAVIAAAREFVTGWLTRDEKRRVKLLAPVVTEELLDGLATTRADNIPNLTPKGKPAIIRAAGGTLEARQEFTDGPPIALLLVIDPTNRHGWRVSSVRPVT